MADSKQALRKPTFTKVGELRPGTSGHTLTVKVVSTKMVLQKGRADGTQARQMRLAECLVGDETGMIIFTARNDQVDLMVEGSTVTLRNAKIDMFKGSMRLAVDKWGRVEEAIADKPTPLCCLLQYVTAVWDWIRGLQISGMQCVYAQLQRIFHL